MALAAGLILSVVALGARGGLPISAAAGAGAAAVLGLPIIWRVRRRTGRDPDPLRGAVVAVVLAIVVGAAVAAVDGAPDGLGWAAVAITGIAAGGAAALYLHGHAAWHRSGWRLPFAARGRPR